MPLKFLTFAGICHKKRREFPDAVLRELQGTIGGSTAEMRKRQVVVTREKPPRSSTNSSMTITSVRYGECQKNHAAGVGGYAVDGCREFMASCSPYLCCYRNFHTREVET
ncbi:hypothetical protein GQ457_02G011180 [Hibiscus cannabinus]